MYSPETTRYFELFSALFALASVLLSAREKTLTWPISIVCILLGLFVYYEAKLYAKCLLNVTYLGVIAYGWYQWLYGGKNKTPLKVSKITLQTKGILVISGLLGTLGLGTAFATYTDADLPYWDSLHTSFSLVAEWMMAKKKLESWIVWFVLDVSYTGLCYYKGLYLFSALHLLYIFLAVYGYKCWKKAYTQ